MKKIVEILTKLVGGVISIVFFISIIWYTFFRTTNVIGELGADKVGRQVTIQTLDNLFSTTNIRVTSEWEETNFIERLIQEPMRTTLRYEFSSSKAQLKEENLVSGIKDFLNKPYNDFLNGFKEITITDDVKASPKEIDEYLKNNGGKTMEDYFSGLGFNKVEVYLDGKKVTSINLKQFGSTKRILGE